MIDASSPRNMQLDFLTFNLKVSSKEPETSINQSINQSKVNYLSQGISQIRTNATVALVILISKT